MNLPYLKEDAFGFVKQEVLTVRILIVWWGSFNAFLILKDISSSSGIFFAEFARCLPAHQTEFSHGLSFILSGLGHRDYYRKTGLVYRLKFLLAEFVDNLLVLHTKSPYRLEIILVELVFADP